MNVAFLKNFLKKHESSSSKKQRTVPKSTEDAAAAVQLLNYDAHEVPADGNCFFHAVVDQLKFNGVRTESGEVYTHELLRALVTSHIHSNPSLQGFLLGGELKDLGRLGGWVGHEAIQALANLLNLEFQVIRSDGQINPPKITGTGGTTPPTVIYLAYNGSHYSSLIPRAAPVAAAGGASSGVIPMAAPVAAAGRASSGVQASVPSNYYRSMAAHYQRGAIYYQQIANWYQQAAVMAMGIDPMAMEIDPPERASTSSAASLSAASASGSGSNHPQAVLAIGALALKGRSHKRNAHQAFEEEGASESELEADSDSDSGYKPGGSSYKKS